MQQENSRLQEEPAPPTPRSGTPLLDCKRTTVCCLSCMACGALLRLPKPTVPKPQKHAIAVPKDQDPAADPYG